MLADLSMEPPTLVSRSDELVAVAPRVLDRFSEVSVMDELAETEDGEDDGSDDEATHPLGGLHAKAFVQENGWDTSITIGSGNATRPALLTGRNVEVFATLTGKRSRVGSISGIFGPDGFGRVLRGFRPAEISPLDAGQRAAEQRIERARRELINAGLALSCRAQRDEEGGQALKGGGSWRAAADDEPILEDMVRALSHGHDRLSAVRRLMERLERMTADDGAAVVPEDFAALWDAFRAVLDEGDRTRA